MKHLILGTTLAALFASASAGPVSQASTGPGIARVEPVDPPPPAEPPGAPPPPPGAAIPPRMTIAGLQNLRLGISFKTSKDDDDWWMLCADEVGCERVTPTYFLPGLTVRIRLGNDGITPITWYQPTQKVDAATADRQAYLIPAFNASVGDALAVLISRTGPRGARAPSTSGTKTGTGGKDSDKPRPAGTVNPFKDQVVIIEGPDTPDPPEYHPPPYDPPPPPDMSPAPPEDGGGGGGEYQDPDGSGWKSPKPASTQCVATLPPLPPAAGCAVTVPATHPPLPPVPGDPPPPPPPPINGCTVFGVGCGGMPEPPLPNPAGPICGSKFVVDVAVCNRNRALGKLSRVQHQQCMDIKFAELARCRATTGAQQVTRPVH